MPTRKPSRKVSSKFLDKANHRLTGLKSIDPSLDLGNGLTIVTYEAVLVNAKSALDNLNTGIATLDDLKTTFSAREKEIRDWNERMLDAVSAKFTKDSNEYEQAGGVRKSQRKRPVRKNKPVEPALSPA